MTKFFCKIIVALLLVSSAKCHEFYQCKTTTCTATDSVDDPGATTWAAKLDGWLFLYEPSKEMLAIANNQRLVCFSEKLDLFFVVNPKTKSLILSIRRLSYLLRFNVIVSLEGPDAVLGTVDALLSQVVSPFAAQVSSESFDLRLLLVYLRIHKNTKGAPGLRRRLSEELEECFGEVFREVKVLWERSAMSVKDYEGCFLRSAIADDTYYSYFAAITSNKIQFGADLARVVYESFTNASQEVVLRQTPLFQAAPELYPSSGAALEALDELSFRSKTKQVANYTFFISYDTRTGYNTINIYSRCGQADLIIRYAPTMLAWSFGCRITNLALFYPDGPNYSLFNYVEGVGIVVSRATGRANIVKSGQDLIRETYWKHRSFQGLSECIRLTSTTKVAQRPSFSFSSFLRNSYILGSVVVMRASIDNKVELGRYFKPFLKRFHLIKGFDWAEGDANVVLFAFHNICVMGLKEDYRSIVGTIAVQESMWRSSSTLVAATSCSFQKFLQLE